jgi:hypothetical protein
LPDGIQQNLAHERFCEKFHRTGLHRAHGHRHVSMAGEKNDRHMGVFGREQGLEREAIELGQLNIEDQAARREAGRMGEKLLRGSESLRLPAEATKQRRQRFAQAEVVIHDVDDGHGLLHVASWHLRN